MKLEGVFSGKEKENLLKSEQYQKQIQKQAESEKTDKFKNENEEAATYTLCVQLFLIK